MNPYNQRERNISLFQEIGIAILSTLSCLVSPPSYRSTPSSLSTKNECFISLFIIYWQKEVYKHGVVGS
jgi:hypothetical protein